MSPVMKVQMDCCTILEPYFIDDGFVNSCLTYAETLDHIMEFSQLRVVGSLLAMLDSGIKEIHAYN
eukprot:Awhi_evm1s4946